MALTVETGAGVPDADAYAALATVGAYWTARPHSPLLAIWDAASEAEKEGAIREATAYLDATWGPHYKGVRRGYAQGLLWPRSDTEDEEGYPLPDLPQELVRATAELAVRAVSAPLAADAQRGGQVRSETITIGPITESKTYSDTARIDSRFGFLDGLLAPILRGTQPGATPSWAWR